MKDYPLVPYVAISVVVLGALLSNWAVVEMTREINRRSGANLSMFWWSTDKRLRVLGLYRRLKPHGNLDIVFFGSLAVMFLTIVTLLVAQGMRSQ